MQRAWTKNEDDRVRKMWAQGCKDVEIGRALGRPEAGVLLRRTRYLRLVKHHCPRWSRADISYLRWAVKRGLGAQAMADELCRTRGSVYRKCAELGIRIERRSGDGDG